MGKFRIAFIPTQNSGVNFYRMASWAWQFRKRKNVECAVYGFNYDTDAASQWIFDVCPEVETIVEDLIKIADISIWGPCYTTRALDLFKRLQLKYGKPMLYESDDDITDVPTWNEAQASTSANSGYRANAIEQLSSSDAAVTTTPFLKERLGRQCDKVEIVPNSLDFKVWRALKVKPHEGVRIGWAGGRNHTVDLMQIVDPMNRIMDRFPQVKLVLVNSGLKTYAKVNDHKWYFPENRVHYVDRYVRINRYPYFLSSFRFDISICPLEICNFNKAKSNIKWLENAGLKVPTVATKVGHFEATLNHGVDALLVENNDPAQWESCLAKLVAERVDRERIGNNAFERAKRDFNIYRNSAKYLNFLRDMAGTDSEKEEHLEWINQPYTPILAV